MLKSLEVILRTANIRSAAARYSSCSVVKYMYGQTSWRRTLIRQTTHLYECCGSNCFPGMYIRSRKKRIRLRRTLNLFWLVPWSSSERGLAVHVETSTLHFKTYVIHSAFSGCGTHSQVSVVVHYVLVIDEGMRQNLLERFDSKRLSVGFSRASLVCLGVLVNPHLLICNHKILLPFFVTEIFTLIRLLRQLTLRSIS